MKQIDMTELEVAYAVSSPFGAGIETVTVIYIYVFYTRVLTMAGLLQTAGTLTTFIRELY